MYNNGKIAAFQKYYGSLFQKLGISFLKSRCQAIFILYSQKTYKAWRERYDLLRESWPILPAYTSVPYLTIAMDNPVDSDTTDFLGHFNNYYLEHVDLRWLNIMFFRLTKHKFLSTSRFNLKPQIWYISCFHCFNSYWQILEGSQCITAEDTRLCLDKEIDKVLQNFNYYAGLPQFYKDDGIADIINMARYGGRSIFAKGTTLGFELIIVQIVSEKYSNATFGYDSETIKGYPGYPIHFVLFDTSMLAVGEEVSFLPLKSDSMTFLTCSNIQNFLTYEIYSHPFKDEIWIWLALGVFSTGLVFQFFSDLDVSS
ncbi:unnamed protein product, partial [Allacma fusca]